MEELVEFQSSVIIVTGLAIDALGAFILILFSGRISRFILGWLNRSTPDDFPKVIDDNLKKEKEVTRGGLICLIAGFVIQAIGHSWPFIRF